SWRIFLSPTFSIIEKNFQEKYHCTRPLSPYSTNLRNCLRSTWNDGKKDSSFLNRYGMRWREIRCSGSSFQCERISSQSSIHTLHCCRKSSARDSELNASIDGARYWQSLSRWRPLPRRTEAERLTQMPPKNWSTTCSPSK